MASLNQDNHRVPYSTSFGNFLLRYKAPPGRTQTRSVRIFVDGHATVNNKLKTLR